MKNTKRSAFTIVELVIVIAVIAILSAVLIPTFGSIIKDANVAADNVTASNLTSELHIYLKGKQIKSEAELMEALDKSGIDRKLTPKAAGYGNHFWFDMENQMIVSDSVEGIKTRSGATASVESGVQLMALTRGANDDINVSFRELVREGYFFIDNSGSPIADLLNKIDKINSAETYEVAKAALGNLDTSAKEDGEYEQLLADTFVKTAIITETYAIAPSGASFVYFEPGIKFVNNVGSLTNLTNETITLPSTVLGVSTGALVFGSENVVLVTSCSDANEVSVLFANGSTNATIKTSAGDYKIGNSDGTTTPFGEVSNVLISNGEVVDGITLEGKLPYADFDLLFKDENNNNSIAHITSGDDKGVYINYGYYAGSDRQIQIYLDPVDGEDAKASSDLIDWEWNHQDMVTVSANGLVTINANADTPADDPIVITATARGVNGNEITSTVNVYINKIEKATVKVGANYFLATTSAPAAFNWIYVGSEYTGSDTTEFISENNVAANYRFKYATCNGDATVSVSVASESGLIANGSKLTLENGASSIAFGNTIPVSITFDGCLTTTANVTVMDNSNLVFQPNFDWHSSVADNNGAVRYYYVGNINSFKLSDIAKVGTGKTFEACDITINGYARNGLYYPVNTVVDDVDAIYELSATINGNLADTISIDDETAWNAVEIDFDGVAKGNKILPVIIEITPKDTSKLATIIELVVVDAKNVYNAAELAETLNDDKKNAVMLNYIIVNDIDGKTKFNVNENKLYGNGHFITALNYAAEIDENGKVKTDDYLFKVTTGGKIENIYLEGPKLNTPYAQFNTNEMVAESGSTETVNPTYVSGIKMIGNCTLSNSYASGFRQPVQINGNATTETTLDNVTLYGGFICNLSLMSGNVKLDNVTTVQEKVTNLLYFDKKEYKARCGAGIVAETGAKDSNITISGNFIQYNWVDSSMASGFFYTYAYDTKVQVRDYLSILFTYYDKVEAHLKDFVHTVSGKRYINTGIIYMATQFVDGKEYTALAPEDIGGTIKFEDGGNGNMITQKKSMSEIKNILADKGSSFATIVNLIDSMFGRIDAMVSIHTYNSNATSSLPVAPGAKFANDTNNFYITNSHYKAMISGYTKKTYENPYVSN